MNRKIITVTVALICLFSVASVWSANVGKITGVVTDAQTMEPLIGVTVAVMGTNLGAITDEDGHYIILNVPVGTYSLRLSAVGFAELEVSNVHVSADLATYQDHELSSEATDLGKTIRVVAERPMVIKDKTTTVNIVRREELLAMPTRGFEQVVGIQNSVVRMNVSVDTRQRGFNRQARAQGGELNLRGGRPSEVAYYVDGFSQQDPLTGISTSNVNNNAIKEVEVISGAFSAEYGHVASGIVQVTTNSGSDEYHGNAEVQTDNHPFYDSYDQNWYSADISGPIPGLEKGYFFLSGERRYLGDRAPSPVTEDVFTQFGVADRFEEPWRLPNNSLSGWSYQGKLDYNFTPNIKLGLSGNGSIDYWQLYQHFYNNPAFASQLSHTPRFVDKNLGLNAKLTHTLNAETFYNLSVSYFETFRRQGDGTLFESDDYNQYQRSLTLDTVTTTMANPEWDVHNLFRDGDSIFASQIDQTIEVGSDADTFITYWDSYYTLCSKRKSSYIGFKGDITTQVGSHHTVKSGLEFQRHTVRNFGSGDATKGYSALRVNAYGYDTVGVQTDDEDFLHSTKHPINLGVYVTDRFDWRGLVINAGLRFDYFDYKALRIKNIEYPLDPEMTGNSDIDESDLEDSEAFKRVSPRLGISFPISDRTQMHINFGKFYQRPDLARLYIDYDFFRARLNAGSYFPFPSPRLEPEKTTQYEFGLTQQLGDNTSFNVTAYYKDVQDLIQIFHQDPAVPRVYDTYDNADYGTIKGVDFGFTMRRTRNIQFNLNYTLLYANGTGSYTGSQFNVAWKNPSGPPKSTNPLDYDQRHNIVGIVDIRTGKGEGPKFGDYYPLENFGLNVIVQAASGTPYTPMVVYDAVSPNASVTQQPTGSINSANLPWTMSVDLKLERTFEFGAYKVVPYVTIRNLLDRENVLAVYEGTGQPNVSGYLESAEGQVRAADPNTGEEFAYRYDYLQNNPNNYGPPRTIYVGLRVSF